MLADKFRARARDATPEEKPAMWREMVSHWPDYDAYQERTDREIPVVVLERDLSACSTTSRSGSSDRAASERFYATVFAPLGIERTSADETFAEWDDFSLVPPTRSTR